MEKKKVMIAMSGGVDSSVAAYILLEKGYDVTGVTIQIWPDKDEERLKNEGGCCSLSAIEDARRVADSLGIPYYVMNFKDVFERNVIDYFTQSYLSGTTPNPCIACNRHIKFGVLMKKALSLGMDYIATGHYARIKYDNSKRRYLLTRSATYKKDQTYALYNLTQEQLSRTLFPIGDYTKDEIRKIAQDIRLVVAEKPESMEICFVEDNDYGQFIQQRIDRKIMPGEYIDKEGNILGMHKGVIHYTIGQRKGLGIAMGKPMYVVDIDVEKNRVVLGEEEDVFSNRLIASDLNFISIERLESEMKVAAKIRYTAKEAGATIIPLEEGRVEVVFDSSQRAITKGQSVVFYNGDVVVGGGIIEKNS